MIQQVTTPDHFHYLEKLLSFKSITPSDDGCIDYIASLLQDANFKTDIQNFGDSNYKVKNLYARFGNKSPNICFAGHVDVVPPGDLSLWKSDPFKMHIEGSKIYGRGTVDMKGAVATMLSAALSYLVSKSPSQLAGSISFLLTADEEGDAIYGTKSMLEYLQNKGEKIDFAIVGEPTSEKKIGDMIKIGRRGSVNFSLIIEGMQGHVAYPDEAVNPVHILVKIAEHLNRLNLDEGTEFFPKSNLEITSIDVGNKVTNVIPQKASMKFNIRFNNLQSPKELVSKIEHIVAAYSSNYTLDTKVTANAFIQSPVSFIALFADIVERVTNNRPKLSTTGGTSDARFIHNYCQVVEFGALNKTAHKINEYIENSDLQILYNVYYSLLDKVLTE